MSSDEGSNCGVFVQCSAETCKVINSTAHSPHFFAIAFCHFALFVIVSCIYSKHAKYKNKVKSITFCVPVKDVYM